MTRKPPKVRLRVVGDTQPQGPLVAPRPLGRSLEAASKPAEGELRTTSSKRLTKAEQQIGALLYPERDFWRPQVRADCANVPRPCPYVGCKFNLYLDVTENGSIKHNYQCEPWDAKHTCALDLAERGGMTLEEVGETLGVTRERVRQVEARVEKRLAQRDDLPDPEEVRHAPGFDLPEQNTGIDSNAMRQRLTRKIGELWPGSRGLSEWQNRADAEATGARLVAPT